MRPTHRVVLFLFLPVVGCGASGAPAACQFANGRTCPVGAVCADGQGCNVCRCDEKGEARCSAVACLDSPVATCSVDADCTDGRCIFDVGCEGAGSAYCARVSCETVSPDPRAYCGCDGTTFNSVCPDRPYRAVGACP